MFFESHAHYNDPRFDEDREELLGSLLKENGVDYVINIGTGITNTIECIELANTYDFCYATVGIHPHYAVEVNDNDIDTLEKLALNNKKVVAVGEIGLDFYYDHSPRDIQIHRFKQLLELSKKLEKPVVIHSREADQLVFDIIKESNLNNSGVIHCYSGSAEMAKEYVKMGFYIGVGGVVTFKNSKNLVETVKKIPLNRILIETDCPYLAPTPHRGERNNSIYLKHIAQKIAEIKEISLEEVALVTKQNALELFVGI